MPHFCHLPSNNVKNGRRKVYIKDDSALKEGFRMKRLKFFLELWKDELKKVELKLKDKE